MVWSTQQKMYKRQQWLDRRGSQSRTKRERERERERERAFRGSFLGPTTQEVRCEFKAQQGFFVSTLQTSRIKSWVKTHRSLNLDERVYPRCSLDLLYYPTVLPVLREIVSYGRRQQSFRGHRERGETEGQRTNSPDAVALLFLETVYSPHEELISLMILGARRRLLTRPRPSTPFGS